MVTNKIQITAILILALTSSGGKAYSSSMEKDGPSFEALEFGQRKSLQDDNEDLLSRDRRRISFNSDDEDPMEHMLSMFHSALQLTQIEDILNQAVEFDLEKEPQGELNRDVSSFRSVVKTPPTPTQRVQFSQKRILTGERTQRLRSPPYSRRNPSSAPPSVRTLPPKQIRFVQSTTATTTPLPIKRLPSFKPQNLPTRQRIRIKVPKTAFTTTTSNYPEPTHTSPVPFRPQTITPVHHLRPHSTTPIVVSSLPSSTPSSVFGRLRSTTSRPLRIKSQESNFIQSNGLKSLRLTSSSGSPPQFQRFKTKSVIRLPHKSAIKSLPHHENHNVHARGPSTTTPPIAVFKTSKTEPFKPSPKIIEGNFVPSTQAWAKKSEGSSKSVSIKTRRRPPVVPRVPIVPRQEESDFIQSNTVLDSGSGFRKGKTINENSAVSSNQELLNLFSTSTNFDCAKQEYPGLYADIETNCQTFHMCQVGGRQNTFICPVGTLFDQRYLVCNWSSRVNCGKSTEYYSINRKIYEPSL